MKNKQMIAVATIRLILAALKDKDIGARGEGNADGINDSDILSMLQSMIKQRKESAKTYAEAERYDLAEREEAEIAVIETFMPQQLEETQIVNAIEVLIQKMGVSDIRDMGRVMLEFKAKYAGQVDMAKASSIVKQKLSR
jgi:hypothetical protein